LGIEHFAGATVTETGDTEIRYAGTGSPVPCNAQGDSGGPVFAGGAVAAIVSHGGAETFCGGNGDIGERVAAYAGWIAREAPSVCETSPDACPADDEGGCGCHAARAPRALPLLVAALILRRRRRPAAGGARSTCSSCGSSSAGRAAAP